MKARNIPAAALVAAISAGLLFLLLSYRHLVSRVEVARKKSDFQSLVELDSSLMRVELAIAAGVVLVFGIIALFLVRLREEVKARVSSETQFARLLAATPDAIIITNAIGKLIHFNDRAVALFGYTREELNEIHVEDLIPARFRRSHREHRRGYHESPTARPMGTSMDLWGNRKDGSVFPVEISLSPVRTDGEVLAIAAIRDVSAQKSAQEALLREKERAEAANRELEAFSYSVAHDLRSPLRSIDGFSLALGEDLEGKLSPDSLDYLLRIRSAAQRMGRLIDDLLSLSRLSRGDLSRDWIDLSALANEIGTRLAEASSRSHAKFTVEPGLTAYADIRLCRVLLENLLGNAFKFSSKQESPRVEMGKGADGSFFVKDNGAGFDMVYADKLFGVFQRLHGEDEFEGTGIGLATVFRVVTRHGGKVWADSQVGAGATFFFTLPSPSKDESA